MRHGLPALVLAAMVLVLAACGGEDAGDPMETYFFDLTVNSASISGGYEGYVPADGNVLLVAEVTVKNTFRQSIEMYDVDFRVRWGAEEGYTYPITTDPETWIETEPVGADQLPGTYTLAADEERTGELVYEVPAGFTDFSIAYLERFVDADGAESTGETHLVSFTAEDRTGGASD